jgi:hypothetical protein
LYIFDYCRKRNYQAAALSFYNEVLLQQTNGNGSLDAVKPVIEFSAIPPLSIPIDTSEGFLWEWWTVFWDMFKARAGSGGSREALVFAEVKIYHLCVFPSMKLKTWMPVGARMMLLVTRS